MNVQHSAPAPRRSVLGNVDPNKVRTQAIKPSTSILNRPPQAAAAGPVVVTNASPAEAVPMEVSVPETPNGILQQEAMAMDWKEAQKSLDHLFDDCLKTRFNGVPKIAMPKILRDNKVKLFSHQVDGIRWLTHREKTNKDPPPFFSERKFASKTYWSDKIQSGYVNYEEKPEPVRGSILADEMSLGKTLQTIGLILANRPQGVRSYPIKRDMPMEEGTPRCTLIVAPVSVMATWAQEIDKCVNRGSEILKVAFYQGYRRHETLAMIQAGSLDVVIASYETLAADMKRSKKHREQLRASQMEQDSGEEMEDVVGDVPVIFDARFHRFVMDEAHIVRNDATKAFRACKKIQSDFTLALTGTPFINNPLDIQSLFAILKVHPLEDKAVYKHYIQQPILDRKEIGLSKLRLALASVCLRRTKEGIDHKLDMVDKSVELRKVGFSGPHKEVHDKLYDVARKGYLALLCTGADQFRKKAFCLFGLMMRIRQSCCTSNVIPESDFKAVEMVWQEFGKIDLDLLDEVNGLRLFETLVDALRTSKGETDDDNDDTNNGDRPSKRIRVQVPQIIPRNLGRSPKIRALMNEIHKLPATEKGVVYSQWTTVLDVIQEALVQDGIHFTRIDGSMTAPARLEAMNKFDTEGSTSDAEPKILLCSLKAAGTGINLTRANHVYMMDCWWNFAQENQAMDRIHRIGQTRPVEAIRFVMSDSIEERVLNVQEAKQTLGKGILKRLKKEERGKAKVTALRDLFEMDRHQFMDWDGIFDDEEDDDDDLRSLIMGDDN